MSHFGCLTDFIGSIYIFLVIFVDRQVLNLFLFMHTYWKKPLLCHITWGLQRLSEKCYLILIPGFQNSALQVLVDFCAFSTNIRISTSSFTDNFRLSFIQPASNSLFVNCWMLTCIARKSKNSFLGKTGLAAKLLVAQRAKAAYKLLGRLTRLGFRLINRKPRPAKDPPFSLTFHSLVVLEFIYLKPT